MNKRIYSSKYALGAITFCGDCGDIYKRTYIEFGQYSNESSYYGLDKLSLNNLIQDNTHMKDYLTYQMMNHIGITAPLSSYANITVNGEDWGLYLAVDAVENGFLQRNYGNDYGELYKPDSMNMGGGRGKGIEFNMDDFMNEADENETIGGMPPQDFERPDGEITIPDSSDPSPVFGGSGEMPEGFDPSEFSGDENVPNMSQDGQTESNYLEVKKWVVWAKRMSCCNTLTMIRTAIQTFLVMPRQILQIQIRYD